MSPYPSFPRKREGGFTFEVQQLFAEDFGWGVEVKAFAGRVVVDCRKGVELIVGKGCEIGFARQEAAHTSDAAFLPWRMGVAEVGCEIDNVELIVACELGAIIESNGLAQGFGNDSHDACNETCNTVSGFAGRPLGDEEARGSVMQGENGLAIF